MKLKEIIEQDYIQALKAKNEIKVAVLRMLKAAIKNIEVEVRHEIGDAEIFSIFNKQAKQRQESIDIFSKAGRQDLVDKEAIELSILQAYMPKNLDESTLDTAIVEIIANIGAVGRQDMGKVMTALSAKYPGQIDGKLASSIVLKKLIS